MAPWSEHTLRRTAWLLWSLQAAVVLALITLGALAPEDASESSWGASGAAADAVFLLLTFAFPSVGMLIVSRAPRNRIGWLLLAGVGATAIPGLLDAYSLYGLAVVPGSLPAADVAAALTEGSWVWWIGSIGIYVILLFPDGRLPSPRWRWLLWLSGGVLVVLPLVISLGSPTLTESPVPGLANPLVVAPVERSLDTPGAFLVLLLLPVCVLAAAVGLVTRFRRSHGVERLQLTWLATAGAVVAATYFLTMAVDSLRASPFAGSPPAWLELLQSVALLSFGLIPVAIGIAVLRHRLYDIDRLINQTLVYGALTLGLLATYLGLVLGLRLLLRPFTGESELAVAASTLVVAALFRPVRSRIQGVVDRRFFRRRYDAARTVAAFTEHLRQQVDLDGLSAGLQGVVRETVQPAHVSLWLRGAP